MNDQSKIQTNRHDQLAPATSTTPQLAEPQPAKPSDDRCWQAVLERDGAFDGQFVTAVRTTRIFCRPSCKAKQPRRENVTFYADALHAKQAGYRACLRCKPETVAPDVELANEVAMYIDAHPDERPTLSDLSQALHVSPYHLQRIFKRVLGVSPRQYAATRRIERVKTALKTAPRVIDAIYDAGYQSGHAVGYDQLGMTAGTFQRGGQGLQLTYTVQPCDLGYVLIALSQHGVCSVTLGDDPTLLIENFRLTYPAATVEADAPQVRTWVETWVTPIMAYLRHQPAALRDIPVDVQATAFQRRVWDALRQIPIGETRTYSEVALAIGAPKAVRAVANACAANKAALVIPCHRVVRGDGTLGGYRWGTARKAQLLAAERQAVPQASAQVAEPLGLLE